MKDFTRQNQILKILNAREGPTKVPDMAKECGLSFRADVSFMPLLCGGRLRRYPKADVIVLSC